MSQLRSMTGFANVDDVLDDGRAVSVRIRSVNARHLEMQARLPAGLDAFEPDLRAMVKKVIRRGHVEVTVFIERAAASAALQVDHGLLAEYVQAHRHAAQTLGLDGEPDLNALLRLPGVMVTGAPAAFDGSSVGPVKVLVERALIVLDQSRGGEGEALAQELRAGAERMQAMTEEAGSLRREVAVSAVDRLRARLEELVKEQVAVGPERLLAEAALLVARGDVEEELVRLRTHLQRFLELLQSGGEVGKPLEFLLQELNREANTLLSKTGGAAGEAGLRLTDLGLSMKVEVERAREQVQNLE